MIRTFIPTIIFSVLVLSCDSTNQDENTNSDGAHFSEDDNDPRSGGMQAVDPYIREDGAEVFPMKNEKEMIVRSIEGEGCDGFSFNKLVKEADVIDGDTLVQRNGDSLTFTFYNKSQFTFVSAHPEDESFDSFRYKYQGLLETIEYWVVYAIGYEYDKTIIIDKFTGMQTETVGMPSVSPDRRFVLVGNADLEARYTENHLSLYKWNSEDLQLLVKASLDLKDWAPFEVNWQDDYHFTIKQGRFNENTNEIDYSCAEVSIE
jgi:hypothetical protein